MSMNCSGAPDALVRSVTAPTSPLSRTRQLRPIRLCLYLEYFRDLTYQAAETELRQQCCAEPEACNANTIRERRAVL